MRNITLILLAFILFSFNDGERKKKLYANAIIRCEFETSQGRMDGHYVSWYRNGRKKSEGKFDNYFRSGIWTVWDSTGRIRMQRDYYAPFTFKRIIPETPDDKLIKLLYVPEIWYEKPEEFILHERMVVWAKQIQRFISPDENPLLFKDNVLFYLINEKVNSGNLIAYKELYYPYALTPPRPSHAVDTSMFTLTSFKILEEYVFDHERMQMKIYPYKISPVVVKKDYGYPRDPYVGDTLELFWVEIDSLSKYLKEIKIKTGGADSKIMTMDDIFRYHFYSGRICGSCDEHPFRPPLKDTELVSDSFEVALIEKEHDLWMHFAR